MGVKMDEDESGEDELHELLREMFANYTQEKLNENNRRRPVFIVDDCRSEEDLDRAGRLTNYKGILLGLYDYQPEFERSEQLTRVTGLGHITSDAFPNPLIYVPSVMEYIWGCQCYWGEVEGMPEDIQELIDKLDKGKQPEEIDWDNVFGWINLLQIFLQILFML
jgi:hypothetical protein